MHTDAWKTVSVSSVQVLHVRHYMYVYNNCSSFKLSYLQVLPVSDYSADSRFLTSTKQHYSLYNKEISDRIRQRCLQSSDINKALHGGGASLTTKRRSPRSPGTDWTTDSWSQRPALAVRGSSGGSGTGPDLLGK